MFYSGNELNRPRIAQKKKDDVKVRKRMQYNLQPKIQLQYLLELIKDEKGYRPARISSAVAEIVQNK